MYWGETELSQNQWFQTKIPDNILNHFVLEPMFKEALKMVIQENIEHKLIHDV